MNTKTCQNFGWETMHCHEPRMIVSSRLASRDSQPWSDRQGLGLENKNRQAERGPEEAGQGNRFNFVFFFFVAFREFRTGPTYRVRPKIVCKSFYIGRYIASSATRCWNVKAQFRSKVAQNITIGRVPGLPSCLHTRLMNIGMLCPVPWGQSLETAILFRLKHNIYAQLSEKTEWRKQKKQLLILLFVKKLLKFVFMKVCWKSQKLRMNFF